MGNRDRRINWKPAVSQPKVCSAAETREVSSVAEGNYLLPTALLRPPHAWCGTPMSTLRLYTHTYTNTRTHIHTYTITQTCMYTLITHLSAQVINQKIREYSSMSFDKCLLHPRNRTLLCGKYFTYSQVVVPCSLTKATDD